MDNSGNAFPTDTYYNEIKIDQDVGLTRREYIAAKLLQGLLANPTITTGVNDDSCPGNGAWKIKYSDIVLTAVEYADELIKELNK